MTGFGFMNSNSSCCSTAAAYLSALNIPLLDTAHHQVVSICVLPQLRTLKLVV